MNHAVACLSLFTAMFVLDGLTHAQGTLPSSMPSDGFFSRLASATLSEEKGDEVAVQIPTWKTASVVMDVPRVKVALETRVITRMVDGKEVTEEYQAPVMLQETIRETVHSIVPEPPKKVGISMTDLKAWSRSGKELTKDEIVRQLSKATHVYALTDEPTKGEPPVDPFYAAAINENVLFVYSESLNTAMQKVPAKP